MLIIKKPNIITAYGKSTVFSNITITDELGRKVAKTLKCEFSKEYEKYIVSDRLDAFLIALYPYAMRTKNDVVCEFPITDILLHNLNAATEMFSVTNKRLKKINITSQGTLPPLENENAVVTLCSGGVDSFYSIKLYKDSEYESLRLTHLLVSDVGLFSSSTMSNLSTEKDFKNDIFKLTGEIADDMGLPLVVADTNFAEITGNGILPQITCANLFPVYALGKLFGTVHIPSTYNISEFLLSAFENVFYNSLDRLDPLLVKILSTAGNGGGISLYTDGYVADRFKKTKALLDFEPAKKFLSVCFSSAKNCGVCVKCRRTLLQLDMLGELDSFKDVFDVDYYREHIDEYLKELPHIADFFENYEVYEIQRDKILGKYNKI
ncbi:MAG: hypothetical protein LBL93_07325 [Ruminococcus sp.]|jgi:hypothetical protein|nr:hypothetical protein [Ruminococcus sp.]